MIYNHQTTGPQTLDFIDSYDEVKRVHSAQIRPFLERE